MVYSTDRSKALVPVLVLLFVALWFILRGDLFYILPCVIFFLCFSVLLALRLPSLGKRELIFVLFVCLLDLRLFGFVCFIFLGVWEGLRFVIVALPGLFSYLCFYSTDHSKAVVPVLVLLFVALWFILRGDLLSLVLCYFLLARFSPFSIAITSFGKRELSLVLFVRLFDLRLFGFVCFLFLLVSWRGCSLWPWHSLRFSLTITKTRLYNFDPLQPHFYIVKLGFTGVYIIFLISAQKHRLWVPVRTASARRF